MSVRVPRGCSYNLIPDHSIKSLFRRNVIGTDSIQSQNVIANQSNINPEENPVNIEICRRFCCDDYWLIVGWADFGDATDIEVIWSSVWFQRMIYLHLKLRALMQWLWTTFWCALGCMLNWTVLHVCWLNEFSIHPNAPPFYASSFGISCLLKYIYYQPVCGFAGMHDFPGSFWGQWGGSRSNICHSWWLKIQPSPGGSTDVQLYWCFQNLNQKQSGVCVPWSKLPFVPCGRGWSSTLVVGYEYPLYSIRLLC